MAYEQVWSRLEVYCRAILAEDGANEIATDGIIGDLKPRMLRIFEATPAVPIEASPEIKAKISELFERNSRACIIVLLRLEAELYWQLVGDPRTPLRRSMDTSATLPDETRLN